MRIPSVWCTCAFVVDGLCLVCSKQISHALCPGLALVLLNTKTSPKLVNLDRVESGRCQGLGKDPFLNKHEGK